MTPSPWRAAFATHTALACLVAKTATPSSGLEAAAGEIACVLDQFRELFQSDLGRPVANRKTFHAGQLQALLEDD
jgi:hypothetical protein